ncbi:MAG: hypothetical protein AAFN07_14935 [Pseudomonadota bacterium]
MTETLTITKGLAEDSIQVTRADGSIDASRFPKKGVAPHDAVHWIVEQELGMTAGFWGTVLSGASIESVAVLAKAGGHASSKRAAVPAQDVVELIQAERVVECFEAEMWSEVVPHAVFQDVLTAACAQSHVSAPEISENQLALIREALVGLHREWQQVAPGGSMALNGWHPKQTV